MHPAIALHGHIVYTGQDYRLNCAVWKCNYPSRCEWGTIYSWVCRYVYATYKSFTANICM